ncbi:Glycosyl hydrolases family 16 [Geodermatophilus telluris]|uniref:Glycosyl hydrolases family 16 n=1 Tax=Geodermatophilus telluris TaxID=1190417 RepID=A0A1G6L7T7_9ACTN|nr:glycoside hydrolase family 16 protein [Geodermatophilus telluris]SDC39359.1 Glycosyl hydrolases family 16 [Geodermatophilus telluris]
MQHRAPRRPRFFVTTSVMALLVGSGGVVGGLLAESAPVSQEAAVSSPDLAEAARTRWQDAQRASREAASRWPGGGRPSTPTTTPAPTAAVPPTTAAPVPTAPATQTPTASATPVPTTSDPAPAATPSSPATGGTAPTTQAGSGTTGGTTSGSTGSSTAVSPAVSAAGFDSVEEFATPVPAGTWPSDGRAPTAYPKYVSYRDGTSNTYYPSQVLSVHDGVLDWNVRNSMGAAVLPFGYQGFTYGTYTVRMRTDNFPDYHIAFLLWPNTDKWTHELDGPESDTDKTNPYSAVLQSTDPVRFLPSDPKPTTPISWNAPEFHNYTWQWGPDFVAFYQDGVQISRVTSNVPNQGMHPVMQVEFEKAGVKPAASISGHVLVDRVMYDPSYTIAVPTV